MYKTKPNVSIEMPQRQDTVFLLRFVVSRMISFSEELRFNASEQEVLPFVRDLQDSLTSDVGLVKIDAKGASLLKIGLERYASFVRENEGDPLDIVRVGYILHEMCPSPLNLSETQNVSMEMLKGVEKKMNLCYFTTSDYLSLMGLLVMLSTEEAFLNEYPSAKRKSFELKVLASTIQASTTVKNRRKSFALSNREKEELIAVFEQVLEMENDPRMQAYRDEEGDIQRILQGLSMKSPVKTEETI